MLFNVALEHGENSPSVPLDLIVRLRVACGRKSFVQTHKQANVLEQPRRELRSGIPEKQFWWAVFENPGLSKCGSNVSRCNCFKCRNLH